MAAKESIELIDSCLEVLREFMLLRICIYLGCNGVSPIAHNCENSICALQLCAIATLSRHFYN